MAPRTQTVAGGQYALLQEDTPNCRPLPTSRETSRDAEEGMGLARSCRRATVEENTPEVPVARTSATRVQQRGKARLEDVRFDIPALSQGLSKGSTADETGCWATLSRFVILPGYASGRWWVELWDIAMGIMMLIIAYYEPYAIALYRPKAEPTHLIYFNHVLNVLLTIDMLLTFFIATQHSEDSVHKDLWEKDVCKLARHYFAIPLTDNGRAGWFWLDLSCVITGVWTLAMDGGRTSNPLLLMRVFRIFHTVRLTRLTKLGEMCHSRYGFPMFVMEVLKFVMLTTLTCHWMACVWLLAEGNIRHEMITFGPVGKESWLSKLIKDKGDPCEPNVHSDPQCLYMLAFYWATMTLTSVGYGDVTAQNKTEYVVSVIGMLVVGYIWAFIVGTIVSILSNLDPASTEFKHTLDELSTMMRRRGLSNQLQVQLRTYMHETRHFLRLNGQRALVERYLSNGLQREVAKNSAEVREMLHNVIWMRDLEEDAILDIVRALQPRACGKGEHINLRGCMIIMQKGIAGVRGRVISRGDVWGQYDILIETPQLIDGAMPLTLSFVEMQMLSKPSLVEVARNYSDADRRLRRAQIRTAVSRALVYRAAQKSRTKARDLSVGSESSLRRARGGCESSFANPGIKRIQMLGELGEPPKVRHGQVPRRAATGWSRSPCSEAPPCRTQTRFSADSSSR